MSVFHNNVIAGAAGQTGGDAAAAGPIKSLRFNSGDSAYLSRTPSSTGNRRTWTYSCWVKRTTVSSGSPRLFGTYDSSFIGWNVEISSSDKLEVHYSPNGSSYPFRRTTTQVFRDPSAWYHFVVAVDTTASTADDMIKLYVNGSQITAFDNNANGSQNTDTNINTATAHRIGLNYTYSDFYLADVHFIDGQQLAASDFGEEDDNGVWQPKEASFTSPNNGTTWSSSTSGGAVAGSYPMSQSFDGSTSTAGVRAVSGGGFVFGGSLGINYSSSVRVHSGASGIGTQQFKLNDGTATDMAENTFVTVATGTGTLNKLEITAGSTGNANIYLGAVEVDGVILQDGLGRYGKNGFHLFDFANESGIGNDSSGNDNDFTANNLVASTLDYSTSGGTVTNAGNALDGNDNTYSQTSSGANSTYTFSPAISVSSGRIDLRARNHSSLTYKAVTNAGTITFTLQGTWPGSGHVDYPGWYYISNASVTSISQIILETSDSSVNWTFTGFQVAGSPSSVGDQFVTAVPGSDLDVLFDVPTNGTQSDTGAGGEVSGNYATFNPLKQSSNTTLSNGNLDIAIGGSSNQQTFTTFGMSSGKWYCEFKHTSGSYPLYGISDDSSPLSAAPGGSGSGNSYAFGYQGKKWNDGTSAAYSTQPSNGDIIGVAFDADNGTLAFYVNGTSLGNAYTSIPSGTYFMVCGTDGTNSEFNAGQRSWAYSAPSGFSPLCTALLPTPTIADGSDYFEAKTYTGASGSVTVSTSFSPDFVWLKNRSHADGWHQLRDIVRGGDRNLSSNSNNAESDASNKDLDFNSDGFTLTGTTDSRDDNYDGDSYVAWCWNAGSSTVSNTDGSITSSVRANQTAGFSIVAWTGTRANATVGHGLNAALGWYVVKRRNTTGDWIVYHTGLTAGTGYIRLNTTDPSGTAATPWNSTAPTSSVFSLGADSETNGDGDDMLAYCFAPVAGYSAFGEYSGNSSSDGVFVHTGFRPAWLMVKSTNATGSWSIFDNKRDPFNVMDRYLFAEQNFAEQDSDVVDFLSNGFKFRTGGGDHNYSGRDYIYLAFAENPFQANGGLAR